MLTKCTLFVTLAMTSLGSSSPVNVDNTCAQYAACPLIRPNMINVHIVPHSHDDVGWVKTVDQYFYGTNYDVNKKRESVQYILDSVIKELLRNQSRRFVYSETAFLWKWWQLQSDLVREQVRTLVKEGRLEIIGGGWTMNDEAVTHYQSVIDQLTWGLRRINDTLGVCGRPRAGWQIDPFGHSREMASILAQMGYDGVFFSRIHYKDRDERMKSKTLETVWQTSGHLENSELFTHILLKNYMPPESFCFDVLCPDTPIVSDKVSPEYNAPTRVEDFLKEVRKQKELYATKNVIFTMGGDFHFQNAVAWYTNLDALIDLSKNQQSKDINMFYSTPSCYLKAANNEQTKWKIKVGDFFPYADEPHAYWTGYYTSKPTIKYFERLGNNFLQICKQVYALSNKQWNQEKLNVLREAMGVMQHHDAVTGTEKDHVARDYCRLLTKGFHACGDIVSQSINALTEKKPSKALPSWESCLLLNISQCAPTEESYNFVVMVYNPLSRAISSYMRFPVMGTSYEIRDFEGKIIENQLISIPEPVQNIPGRTSKATHELVFRAVDVPPMSFYSYFVRQTKENSSHISRKEENSNLFGYNKFYFATDKNNLTTLSTRGVNFQFSEEYAYYEGVKGNGHKKSSGAYLFIPKKKIPETLSEKCICKVFRGPLVTEKHETFSNWLSQIVRIYNEMEYAEFEWLVGPIPIDDDVGKEVIVKYITSVNSTNKFYTDSNGRGMMERTRGDPSINDPIAEQEQVASNYYPVSNRISLRDPKAGLGLSVVTDRAQGGSSLAAGQLELMLHRRLLQDDGLGVDEPLNERAFESGLVVRGKHYLTAGRTAVYERLLAQEKLLQPWMFFFRADNYTFETWSERFAMKTHGVRDALPKNVHILTLEPWKDESLLLRLEHILEKDDDPNLSKPVEVQLQKLFVPFEIVEAREAMLGANEWIGISERLHWNFDSKFRTKDHRVETRHRKKASELSITLTPMQIRTFIVTFKR